MSFDKQLSEACEACYFHIRALCHIRSSLTTQVFKRIAIDYDIDIDKDYNIDIAAYDRQR